MKRIAKLSFSLFSLAAALLFASAAYAQGVGASGDIVGTITDLSGAAIPKAKVTATDTVKGISRLTFTDDHGEYRLSGLAPSTYDLSVERQSFQSATEHNIVLPKPPSESQYVPKNLGLLPDSRPSPKTLHCCPFRGEYATDSDPVSG